MLPFQPPLPTAWNFPFQPVAGSQTSILMSESLEGLSVAATRQNAGRSANCAPPPPRPPAGGVNAPAATGCAIVMVASGSLSELRLSHVAAAAGPAIDTLNATNTAAIPSIFIGVSSWKASGIGPQASASAEAYFFSGNANT